MEKAHAVIAALEAALGKDVVTNGEQMDRRTSYWNSAPATAIALLRPRNTEEVSKALAICHQHHQAVVTQGGMTNCVESADAQTNEVILSLERINQIEHIDVAGGTATVGAGVILQVLQDACLEQNVRFPLDLGARGSCTVGGNAATNAGGINALRYGMMRNLVLGMEVVLVDGTVLSAMNQMLKNNAGYDLKQLFIGSEGTLGVITRLVLKLFPKPLSCQTALVALKGFEQVMTLLQTLQRDMSGTLSAYEVMWGHYFKAVTVEGAHRAPLDRDYPFYVVLETEGADPEADGEHFTQVLEQALENEIIVDAVLPKSETERRAIWEIRENFDTILAKQPSYIYDVSLPLQAMPSYVEQVQAGLKQRWPDSCCYVLGHIADGNLHLFISPGVEGEWHADCDVDVYQPLQQYQGSVSAEHGIGLEKKAWLESSRSPAEMQMMRTLKQALDPKGLLNKGRVFTA